MEDHIAELAALDVEDTQRQLQHDARYRDPQLLYNSAVWYATHGWAIFPLQPNTKIPWRGSHGFQDATTIPATIHAWWTSQPQSNIGFATGHVYDVIDIDGAPGFQSAGRLREEEHLPPILGKAWTPHGLHLYITPTGDGNTARWQPGLDYRGIGGYVVLPPSLVDGRRYEWWERP